LQRKLASQAIELSLSVRETEKFVKRISKENNHSAEKKSIKPKLDANVKAAETMLRRRLGTQVNILPDGKGTGGKIEVEYYSDSDLDRIYSLILGNQ
jgi:ParB family chromosome partitioning protein